MNVYLVMAALYLGVALLAAVDSSLTNFALIPWFNGLRWLRVHLITLGVLAQGLFGVLPNLVAIRAGRPKPRVRLEIWFLLNAGLLTLLVGIPLSNAVLIFTGGTLVFIAAFLLLRHLHQLGIQLPRLQTQRKGGPSGRNFYLAGLAFFLVGILAGTGLWLGWSVPLHMARPREVHLHANIWGLMSFAFAGLIVDLYPRFAGRSLAWPRTVRSIFWIMTGGSLLLLIGPWVGLTRFTGPGMILHLAGTAWLLLNVIVPLFGDRRTWSRPGVWHLLSAYYWVLTPLLAVPLMISGALTMPRPIIEQDAGQWLVYSWLLHFGYALLPYLFRRALLGSEAGELGGSWLSLVAVHLGYALFWAAIFIAPLRSPLYGSAYALWALSMLPIVRQLWQIVQAGLFRLEESSVTLAPAEVAVTDE